MQHSFTLPSLAITQRLAETIARTIVPGFVISLNGNLGTGKTTLVRNILHSMGIKGNIKSPTFNLVHPYQVGDIHIHHFDLYRFSGPDEWFESGFDEYFTENSICFIEWADKAAQLIPHVDWSINLTMKGDAHYCQINAATDKGRTCLKAILTSEIN